MVENPYIGRIVTLLSPVIAGVSAGIANWAQDAFGANLDGTQLTVFLTGVVVAVLYVVKSWLDNRGAYERLVEAGQDIMEAGREYAPPPPDPDGEIPPPPDAGPSEPAPPEEGNRRGA